jgi:hypothetical protein
MFVRGHYCVKRISATGSTIDLRVRALLTIVAVSAAVAAPVAATVGGRPTDYELRGCNTRGEGRAPQKPPPGGGIRIGPLMLWPSLDTTSGPTIDPRWRYVAKAPVVLRARTKLILAVAPGAARLAAFQSNRHGYVHAVRFEACRESQPAFAYDGTVGKLTGFPFAIGLTRKSACVPLEVWVDGRARPFRRVVAIGRRSC